MTAPVENTPNAIIVDAMVEAGKLQRGQRPDGDAVAANSRRLRDLINAWQTTGLRLWLQVDLAIPLVVGQNKYSLKPGGDVSMVKPLRVSQDGYYRDSTNAAGPVDRPIFQISRNDWMLLSTKSGTATEGAISQFFVDKQQLSLDVYFWLTPDTTTAANGQAHLLVQQQVTNFTNITDTMNFPVEWRLALLWGLADEICTGAPGEVQMRCAQRALAYKTMLDNWDVEDANTRFAPDMTQQGMSSFL